MTKNSKAKATRTIQPKQKLFCDYYLTHYNATKAAIQAGYSKSTAKEQGYQLLHNSSLQEYLSGKVAKTAGKLEITHERVMQEIARISFSDVRKLFKEDGSLKNISDLDDDTAAALAGFDVDELFEGNGKGRVQIGVTKKAKMWDKTKGLEMLAKHFKIYEDDGGKVSFNVTIN